MARISSTAVRQGLAKRAQPKQTAQSTGARPAAGGRIDPERFQNPMTARRAKLARGGLDYQRFQNPNVARQAVGTLHPQFAAGAPSTGAAAPATRRVDPAQTTIHGGFRGATATAGAPPQTPGRPGGRFGTWTPRAAAPVYPRPAAAPMQPVPARQPMQVAQAAPQPVPGQYQSPGRPMVPTMAQAAPMPVPQPVQTAQPFYPQPAPQVAQPAVEPPQQEMARLQQRIAQLQQQAYNPTPYMGR